MTERERIRDEDPRPNVGVYSTGATTTTTRTTDGSSFAGADAAIAPADLVRWGPIIAGLFATFATLAALTVLGVAIGLTAFDVGERAGPFGVGAGIWGAISVLLSFLVGGYFAGRTAAVRGTKSGILQGGMIWFVAIPLLVYSLSGTLSGFANALGGVAGTAAQTAGQAAGAAAEGAAENPGAAAGAAGQAQDAAGNLQATATAVVGQVDQQDVQNVVEGAGQAAWGTLLSLGLAAGASILGGWLGARRHAAVSTTTRRTA